MCKVCSGYSHQADSQVRKAIKMYRSGRLTRVSRPLQRALVLLRKAEDNLEECEYQISTVRLNLNVLLRDFEEGNGQEEDKVSLWDRFVNWFVMAGKGD